MTGLKLIAMAAALAGVAGTKPAQAQLIIDHAPAPSAALAGGLTHMWAVKSANGLFSIDPKWSLDCTARAGYLIDRQTLAYLGGGYATARAEPSVANGRVEIPNSEKRSDWLLGGSVERRLLHRISGRLEYHYSDVSEGGTDHDRHRVLAGIAYRF